MRLACERSPMSKKPIHLTTRLTTTVVSLDLIGQQAVAELTLCLLFLFISIGETWWWWSWNLTRKSGVGLGTDMCLDACCNVLMPERFDGTFLAVGLSAWRPEQPGAALARDQWRVSFSSFSSIASKTMRNWKPGGGSGWSHNTPLNGSSDGVRQ